jgi:hypothetical protein
MIEILLVKSSVLIFAAMVLCAAMRRGSAAFRHLVWLCAFGALLILPAGSLLPPSTVPAAIFPVAIVERPDVAALTPNMSNLSNIGFATWLCGALFLLAKLIVDYMRGLRLLENSHPVDSNGRYGVAISEALAGPVAWGIGSRRRSPVRWLGASGAGVCFFPMPLVPGIPNGFALCCFMKAGIYGVTIVGPFS